MLKVILFAFMENGYASTREIEKYCKTDIRYMWLLDGTKIPANANKYSWVWKKSSIKNRNKTFGKITALFEEINEIAVIHRVKFGKIHTEP